MDSDSESHVESQTGRSEVPDYGTAEPGTELEPQDLDLIRWFLTLTPAERVRYAQRFASGARRLKLADRA